MVSDHTREPMPRCNSGLQPVFVHGVGASKSPQQASPHLVRVDCKCPCSDASVRRPTRVLRGDMRARLEIFRKKNQKFGQERHRMCTQQADAAAQRLTAFVSLAADAFGANVTRQALVIRQNTTNDGAATHPAHPPSPLAKVRLTCTHQRLAS